MKPIEILLPDDRKIVVGIDHNDRVVIQSYYHIHWVEQEFQWNEDYGVSARIDAGDWAAFVAAINKMDKLMVLK